VSGLIIFASEPLKTGIADPGEGLFLLFGG
jgi:hypothetical protein